MSNDLDEETKKKQGPKQAAAAVVGERAAEGDDAGIGLGLFGFPMFRALLYIYIYI